MTRQLAFDWPMRVALGADDFFVSEANADAYAMVTAPERWQHGKLVLIGPARSGKSHLAKVYQIQSGAPVFSADALPDELPRMGNVVIEDMERLPKAAEAAMFHLHNNLAASGGQLLMTADRAPGRWPVALPDLASRMTATTTISIRDPDDRLLAAVIMKLFDDRQLAPSPRLVGYLAARIERSFAAATAIVAALDAEALLQGREINERLAATLLDKSLPQAQK
jgi:chromosomal replication initiation ATPase DnaA